MVLMSDAAHGKWDGGVGGSSFAVQSHMPFSGFCLCCFTF